MEKEIKEINFTPNDNFYYYIYWIKERMNIFWNRVNGEEILTEDPILKEYKFTNVYRCLDRTSQYLIKNVIYNGKEYSDEDMFWRILLFKHFNKSETWDKLISEFGDVTLDIPLSEIDSALKKHKEAGIAIYSNAYMMTASFMKNERICGEYHITNNNDKHSAYLQIFQHYLIDSGKIIDLLEVKSLSELTEEFSKIVTIGQFLAMQYSIDLNYSPLYNFDENDFIIPGPGALRGIDRTFDFSGPRDYSAVIKWVCENFDYLLSEYGDATPFRGLPNRKPKLIDIQNCFCEIDKYLRGMGVETEGVKGKRIKATFSPKNSKIEYTFPEKWGVKIL